MLGKAIQSGPRVRVAIALVLLVVSAGHVPATADDGLFDDVGDGHIFSGEIEWLAAAGITRGCNPPDNSMFCPDDRVTRGQMAAFLVRALGLQDSGSVDFVDDDGSVFESSIEKLAAAGITRGCNPPDNSRFCPEDPVTRAQMAAFLYRALHESPRIDTASIADAVVGVPYEEHLKSSGGFGAHIWTITSGDLPDGLDLGRDGVIAGTPSVGGQEDFTVSVTDSAGESASAAFTLRVQAPLNITTDKLAFGIRANEYSATADAAGGFPPYRWSLAEGSLPSGLLLSDEGVIQGTPVAAGSWVFTLEVADSSADSEAREYRIDVHEPLEITDSSTPTGVEGDAYWTQFSTSGGVPPYSWSIHSGSPPPGIQLTTDGQFVGTPVGNGTWHLQVAVTDTLGLTDTADLDVTINAPLEVATVSLPDGVYDGWYEARLAATGGIGPYTWEVTSGGVPTGLSLAGDGWITGNPETFWGDPFTVTVTDSRGATSSAVRSVHVTGTLRVSVSSFGVEGNADSGSGNTYGGLSVSEDGRFVAFDSDASNLVPGDTNNATDIFVHDVLLGTTTRISVAPNGAEANADSSGPEISNDGRYVAFISAASNLVASDINGMWDVFVRDLATGTTEIVSVASDGTQANNGTVAIRISADGGHVAFGSDASNLVPDDTNGRRDVFLRDRAAGTTVRLNVSSDEQQTNGWARWPDVSAGGLLAAFATDATDVVPGDTTGSGGQRDLFIRDVVAGTTTRVMAMGGAEANGSVADGQMSPDGEFIVFWSTATNWIVGDSNGRADIFVYDTSTGLAEAVSVNNAGALSNGYSLQHGMSDNGRWVGFSSYATNLTSTDNNSACDVFLRDRLTGTTTLMSRSSYGATGSGESLGTDISGSGNAVVFRSDEAVLVPGDSNGVFDVFIRFW